ncbi:MAG: YrbL family protein [Sulfurimonas sp.]|jgi:hypothetical protein|nr:YrbL family protein [Sulfurimonadaceae bacterium]
MGEVVLSKEEMFARGGQREVYIHPQDSSKIIKVSGIGSDDQNELEFSYFEYIKTKDVPFKHMAKYFGKIKTSLGDGLVYERILDFDGSNSTMLVDAIRQKVLTKDEFLLLFEELKGYVFKYTILFLDVSLDNVLLQEYEKGRFRFTIIDGLGGRYEKNLKSYLRTRVKFFSLIKIKKQWEKFARQFYNECDLSFDGIFEWDTYSDQPAIIKNRDFKKRVRSHYLNDYMKMFFTSLYILPLATVLMKFFKGQNSSSYGKLVGLGVNLDKGDEQFALVEELGVKNLIIRVFLSDIKNLDKYVEFAKGFNKTSKKNIVINIIQDREHIENGELLRENIAKIFREFDGISSEFQVGNAINRLKWGFFSIKREYIPFFQNIARVRDEQFKHIKLLGPSVIDFEYYYNARVMFNMQKLEFDATSALLYVDRRGSPKNKQYGFFDLKNKIDLLFSLVKLSPKTLSDDIYITETNWPIKNTAPYAPTSEKECVTNEEYTKYMLEYFSIAKESRKIKKVFWHQLIATGYGLVDNRDGKIVKYPQFYEFKKLLQNRSA